MREPEKLDVLEKVFVLIAHYQFYPRSQVKYLSKQFNVVTVEQVFDIKFRAEIYQPVPFRDVGK